MVHPMSPSLPDVAPSPPAVRLCGGEVHSGQLLRDRVLHLADAAPVKNRGAPAQDEEEKLVCDKSSKASSVKLRLATAFFGGSGRS